MFESNRHTHARTRTHTCTHTPHACAHTFAHTYIHAHTHETHAVTRALVHIHRHSSRQLGCFFGVSALAARWLHDCSCKGLCVSPSPPLPQAARTTPAQASTMVDGMELTSALQHIYSNRSFGFLAVPPVHHAWVHDCKSPSHGNLATLALYCASQGRWPCRIE